MYGTRVLLTFGQIIHLEILVFLFSQKGSSIKLPIEMLTNRCNLNDFQYTIWRMTSPLCVCDTEKNFRMHSIHFDGFQDLLKDDLLKEKNWYDSRLLSSNRKDSSRKQNQETLSTGTNYDVRNRIKTHFCNIQRTLI